MVFQIFFPEVPERPLVPLGAQEAPFYIHRDRRKRECLGFCFFFWFLVLVFCESVQPKDTTLLELAVVKAGHASPYF